jgi:hypothetical protein
MSWLSASQVPLAVRVRNARVDMMITGWLHEAPTYSETDPGGFAKGSIVVSLRLGFREDILQDYSRIYIYDKCTGICVFEGDVSHPGRTFGADGELLQVDIEGGKERLNDWSGARIYCDSDFSGWQKTGTSAVSTNIEASDDRGLSGEDALTLAFPMDTHVENNHRAEASYFRIREAGQKLGRINWRYDGGHTSGSPGWLVRQLATTPSVVARSVILNVSGASFSAAYVGPSWADTADVAFLQLIWTSGSSSTGTAGADIVWASIMDLTVVAYLWLKDGTRRLGSDHTDYVTAPQVWEDMLGDPLILANSFDGPNAQLDTGLGFQFLQLAFPDGVTPAGIAEELMKMESNCTYLVGPSNPANNKYTLTWLNRPNVVRYEAMVWTDEWDGGLQPVEQYDRAVARWKTKTGNIRITVTTQTIPEMAAAGRSRTFWQDLGDNSGTDPNAAQANATALQDGRYPKNSGRLGLARPIVDRFTGRYVQPWEVKPAYLIRLVGVDPSPDGLNAVTVNGSTVCRIVTKEYNGADNAATLDLDSVPWGVFRAIEAARKKPTVRKR